MNKSTFIQKYSKAVHEGYAAVFAGAGFVDWRTLVKPFAEEIELDIEKEIDLAKVTQYYHNSKRRPNFKNIFVYRF